MNFRKYLLNEYTKPVNNEVDLVYQQLLDNLDDGHIDMSDDEIMFNIVIIIKNSSYNNLDLVIRKSQENQVRLGRDSEDKPTIVIDTTKRKLPTRKNINSFLEDIELSKKIKTQLKKYINSY